MFDDRWTSWFPDGKKKAEGVYLENKENGIHIQWHPNGKIKSKAEFLDGKISGLRTEWYDNGQKKEGGTVNGFWVSWFSNGKKEKIVKKILKRKYKIQRIDGLPENKVTPPESVYKRIKAENNRIGEARAINSELNFFKDKFIMPVDGIITGVYGSQRILNGKPKWPHYGIDIAAKQGTQIKSSATGIVTMAEDDLYYTGGTIIMDHGHGISTIYSHLENVLVSVGDKINQGDIIGTVGSTGRSTGPHLDFRINWFQTRLDPMSVLKN